MKFPLSNKTFIENNTLEKLSQVIYKIKTTGEYSTLDEHIACALEKKVMRRRYF
ncbi:hypothetical protein P4S72_25665 [Vibrio sp. PP-XX7]